MNDRKKSPRSIYFEGMAATRAKELIGHMMREKNLSSSDLASLLGTSRANVSCLLKGRSSMNLSTLARAAFVMGFTVSFSAKPLPTEATSCQDNAGGPP